VADYRVAGGADGLISGYIAGYLQQFADDERRAVLKAMLALANLENSQRLPEGRTLAELASAARWPVGLLAGALNRLADPNVRVLERLEGSSEVRYRLPHERLIPALERLSGRVLADVEQAWLVLDRGLRLWRNSERRPRLLLTGGELRQVVRYRA